MSWRLTRLLPVGHPMRGVAGSHVLGDTTLEFDEAGVAETDAAAVVKLALEFPGTFVVEDLETHQEIRTAATLEALTVVQLEQQARSLGVLNVHNLRKQELIDAILAHQALPR